MRVNEVEELLQISRANIRFYEKEGLLHPKRAATDTVLAAAKTWQC